MTHNYCGHDVLWIYNDGQRAHKIMGKECMVSDLENGMAGSKSTRELKISISWQKKDALCNHGKVYARIKKNITKQRQESWLSSVYEIPKNIQSYICECDSMN